MPTCQKCDLYSDPSVEICPNCSSRIQFSLDHMINEFKKDIPNALAKYQEKTKYLNGFTFAVFTLPSEINKGETTELLIFVQSFFAGPSDLVITAVPAIGIGISNSGLKLANKYKTQLSHFEAVKISIPIETGSPKPGVKKIVVTITCMPKKGVKMLNFKTDRNDELLGKGLAWFTANAISLAATLLIPHNPGGPYLPWEESHSAQEVVEFKVSDKETTIIKEKQEPRHKTIFPVVSS